MIIVKIIIRNKFIIIKIIISNRFIIIRIRTIKNKLIIWTWGRKKKISWSVCDKKIRIGYDEK